MNEKTIEYSKIIMTQIMLPNQANPAGNVHGGEIMKIMDNAAYVVAKKHARTNIVTARVDELQFFQPIYVGDLITCRAELVFVGKSSMEIQVRIQVDDLKNDNPPVTALTAYFTMVALDDKGRPVKAPMLILKTPEERKSSMEGQLRYDSYKRKKQGI